LLKGDGFGQRVDSSRQSAGALLAAYLKEHGHDDGPILQLPGIRESAMVDGECTTH